MVSCKSNPGDWNLSKSRAESSHRGDGKGGGGGGGVMQGMKFPYLAHNRSDHISPVPRHRHCPILPA